VSPRTADGGALLSCRAFAFSIAVTTSRSRSSIVEAVVLGMPAADCGGPGLVLSANQALG
jgi:hypothetical protein